MGDGMSRGPYQWARPPKVYGGLLKLTFEDGSSELRNANSPAWEPYEEASARAMLGLRAHDDAEEVTHFDRLGDLQAEDKTTLVAVRRLPGYKNSGFDTAELESKDAQIARLQYELKMTTAVASLVTAQLTFPVHAQGWDQTWKALPVVYEKGKAVPMIPGVYVYDPTRQKELSAYKVQEMKFPAHVPDQFLVSLTDGVPDLQMNDPLMGRK